MGYTEYDQVITLFNIERYGWIRQSERNVTDILNGVDAEDEDAVFLKADHPEWKLEYKHNIKGFLMKHYRGFKRVYVYQDVINTLDSKDGYIRRPSDHWGAEEARKIASENKPRLRAMLIDRNMHWAKELWGVLPELYSIEELYDQYRNVPLIANVMNRGGNATDAMIAMSKLTREMWADAAKRASYMPIPLIIKDFGGGADEKPHPLSDSQT